MLPKSTPHDRAHITSNGHVEPSEPTETTPLIVRDDAENVHDEHDSTASSLLRSLSEGQSKKKGSRLTRWPSIFALIGLSLAAIVILIVAFILPHAVQDYAMQAMVIEPTNLSIDSFTPSGVIARVQATLIMDASRVRKKSTRDLGRFGTWIAREVETKQTQVHVTLPRYGDKVIGTADVPPLKLNVQNGHTTSIDFLTHLQPGSVDILRHAANDWIEGQLDFLQIYGRAAVNIKSGILPLGTKNIFRSFYVRADDLPEAPQYNISNTSFGKIELPNGREALSAKVGLQVANKYPIDITIPPLGFAISVPHCAPGDPYIRLADATTQPIHIESKKDLALNVTAFIRELPKSLTNKCPDSHESPLDAILGGYIHGADTIVYVRGAESPSLDTPGWITELMSSVTVPVPFPGHSFGHLIRRFSLANVLFSLPEYDADPGTPLAEPHISAKIKALIALPKEMQFPITVTRVKADADIFYHSNKLGFLDLAWQDAFSRSNGTLKGGELGLEVESDIRDAPLTITDNEIFGDVIQGLITSRHGINLTIKAKVDVALETALGKFVVRQIPATGIVPVRPIHIDDFKSLVPKIGNLRISETDAKSLTLDVLMNFTNPTEYSATVPYVDVNILVNGTVLGHATARNISVTRGNNTNIPVRTIWQPSKSSGQDGIKIGRELLSQYISGYNTTLTLKTHNGTLPSQPGLGRALESLEFTLPTPRVWDHDEPDEDGGDDDDGEKGSGPRFIKDATMHLFSSSAIFTLVSPIKLSTIFITHLNATAYHEGDGVGKILYDGSLAVPPGESTTPRLPVEWSLDSVGYEAVKQALGGTLSLSAKADVGLRIGMYHESVWYTGAGIGAKVRL